MSCPQRASISLAPSKSFSIFIPQKDVKKAQDIVKESGFQSLDAGYVKDGPRQVIIKPKNIAYTSETLDLR